MALKNSQYDIIIRAYNQKQFKNKHDLDIRVNQVYEAIPRIKVIDEQFASISVACAKEMLEGNDSALDKLRTNLSALSEERRLLLKQGDFSDNYMELQHHCSDCGDTGYIDGKKCHCFKQAVIEMFYTQSNLIQVLEKENFSTFSFDYYKDDIPNSATNLTPLENMKKIVNTSQSFIRNFKDSFDNLFFYGDTGVGKTFLSNCIAKELMEQSYSVIYLTAIQLFDLFSKSTFDQSEEKIESASIYQYVLECDLLIIDDLGTELTNSFTNSKLFYTINERFLRQKPIIISTNLTLDMVNQVYSERIFSRISSNYSFLKFYGDDIRIQKKIFSNQT
ncbi:MAG: ATP-binding protein [Clostridiales bacterium]|nr:ATP-binding protein [Clostridiales bacterium]